MLGKEQKLISQVVTQVTHEKVPSFLTLHPSPIKSRSVRNQQVRHKEKKQSEWTVYQPYISKIPLELEEVKKYKYDPKWHLCEEQIGQDASVSKVEKLRKTEVNKIISNMDKMDGDQPLSFSAQRGNIKQQWDQVIKKVNSRIVELLSR